MAGRDIRAGGAFVEFSLRRKKLERGLRQVGQRISQFGVKINQIGTRVAGIGAVIAAPFAGAIATYAKVSDSLEKMSRRTGIAVESLSELQFAAEQNGSSLDTLERGIKTSQRAIVDLSRGLSTQVFAFEALGLAYSDLQDLSPEQQFLLIADRVSRIEDTTKKAATAMQIFGRAGQELIPLLSEGAAGMEKFREEARAAGIVINDETAKSAAAFNDAINKLKLQLKAAAVAVGAALGPALTALASRFTEVGRQIIDFIKENKTLVVTVASVGVGLIAAGGALIALGTAVGLAGFAITSLAGLLAALTSPIALVIGGVVALGAALVKFTDAGGQAIDFLRDKFGQLLETATQAFSGVRKAIEAGDIQLAAEILWTSLQLMFFEGTQELIKKGIELKAGFLKAMTELGVGAVALASELYARLQKTWANITAGAKAIWTNLKGDVAETFNLIRLQASKAGSAIRDALDPDFNADAANRAAEKLFVQRQKDAQDERKKAIAQIEEEQEKRLKQINEEAEARKSAIAEALDAELAAIDEGKKSEANRLRERIENLKEEQAALLKQADTIKSNAEAAGDAGIDDTKESDPGGGGFRAREIARVAGITSSFNIRSLDNTSQSEAKRLRQVNEQQLQETRGLRKDVRSLRGRQGLAIN